jgi:ribosome-associated protein
VHAVAEHLVDRLKQSKLRPIGVEGLQKCNWVLIDAGDIIAHVFQQEVREFYNLEKMWSVELPASEQAAN